MNVSVVNIKVKLQNNVNNVIKNLVQDNQKNKNNKKTE